MTVLCYAFPLQNSLLALHLNPDLVNWHHYTLQLYKPTLLFTLHVTQYTAVTFTGHVVHRQSSTSSTALARHHGVLRSLSTKGAVSLVSEPTERGVSSLITAGSGSSLPSPDVEL